MVVVVYLCTRLSFTTIRKLNGGSIDAWSKNTYPAVGELMGAWAGWVFVLPPPFVVKQLSLVIKNLLRSKKMTTSSQTEGVVSALFLDTSRWGSDHILRGRGGPPTSICSVTAHTSLSQGN